MTKDEKAKAYDELVERLHTLCDDIHRRCVVISYHVLRKHLPPRPPKIVEVPWHVAIEGLRLRKYKSARVRKSPPIVMRDGILRYDQDDAPVMLTITHIEELWHAELA